MSCKTWVNSMSRRVRTSDPFADVLHDLIDIAVAILLETDGEVSSVGFSDGSQTHLQSGTATGDLDLGSAAQNLLHVLKNAVCLGE